MPGIGSIDPIRIIMQLIALLVALTVHEAAHAWMAARLGDNTARAVGRLTLNPLAHLDPIGTIMIIYTTIFGFGIGWAKPVPVNPYRLRLGPQTGGALVSVAGPSSNFLVAILSAGVLGLVAGLEANRVIPGGDYRFFSYLISSNVIIALFNLIPIPPLDGFHVLIGLVPRSVASALAPIEQYGPLLLLVLVFFGMGFIGTLFRIVGGPILLALQQLAELVATLVIHL